MKQAPDGAARLAELQYLLRYGGMKEACPASGPVPSAGSTASRAAMGLGHPRTLSQPMTEPGKPWSGWPDLNRRPLHLPVRIARQAQARCLPIAEPVPCWMQ